MAWKHLFNVVSKRMGSTAKKKKRCKKIPPTRNVALSPENQQPDFKPFKKSGCKQEALKMPK